MVEFTYLEVEVGPVDEGPAEGEADPVSMLETLAEQGWEIVTDTLPAHTRLLLMRKQV